MVYPEWTIFWKRIVQLRFKMQKIEIQKGCTDDLCFEIIR